MRRLSLLLSFLAVLTVSVSAQAPRVIPYQGTLTDGGTPVTTATPVVFDLFDAGVGGTSVWSETQSVTPDADGRFAVGLGTVTDLPADFDQVLWLAVTADGTAVGPRTPLGAAPHALALYGVRVAPPTTAGNAPSIVAGHPTNEAGPGSVVSGGGALTDVNGFPSYNRALGSFSAIGGGASHLTRADAVNTTIGGGYANEVSEDYGTVGGGSFNGAYGFNSTVGGGASNVTGIAFNITAGSYATIPGGQFNRAQGDYSFAAGRSAGALHDGTFVWSDAGVGQAFASTAEDQFLINAGGGVGVGTNAPTAQLHVETDAFASAVYGRSVSAGGSGVRGVTTTTQGSGVFGESTASGTTYGVRGEIGSTFGAGVYGVAGGGGTASGVYGRTAGSTGASRGVLGQSNSNAGTGVYGLAAASSGVTYAVRGEVTSPSGYAGYFTGGRGLFVDAGNSRGIYVENDGGSGLNTATVFAENTSTGTGTVGWFEGNGDGQIVVANQNGTGDLYRGIQSGNLRFRVTAAGNVSADGTVTGGGADLAEFFPLADGADVTTTQVVGLRGGLVSLSTDGAEQIAVISSNPAFIGNPDAADGGALVALVGQVEVQVSGDAAAGDLLIASGAADGRARAVSPTAYRPADGAVIGRVLTADGGRVMALVGVDEAAALRGVVARQQAEIDALRADRDAELDALRDEVRAIRALLEARVMEPTAELRKEN